MSHGILTFLLPFLQSELAILAMLFWLCHLKILDAQFALPWCAFYNFLKLCRKKAMVTIDETYVKRYVWVGWVAIRPEDFLPIEL